MVKRYHTKLVQAIYEDMQPNRRRTLMPALTVALLEMTNPGAIQVLRRSDDRQSNLPVH